MSRGYGKRSTTDRPWFQRRLELGHSSRLLEELRLEDETSFRSSIERIQGCFMVCFKKQNRRCARVLAFIVTMTNCGSLWYCRNGENKRIFHFISALTSRITFNVYGQNVRLIRFCIISFIQIHLNNSNRQTTISVYTVQCLSLGYICPDHRTIFRSAIFSTIF